MHFPVECQAGWKPGQEGPVYSVSWLIREGDVGIGFSGDRAFSAA